MEKFIITIFKNQLSIYEVESSNKFELFTIKGENYLKVVPDNIKYSLDIIKDYLLDILNYEDFSNVDFHTVYDGLDLDTEFPNIFKQTFLSSNRLEVQNLKQFITTIFQKNKLIPSGEKRVISFQGSRWMIKVTNLGEIIIKKTQKNEVDIKFKDNLIPAILTNDYSYIKRAKIEEKKQHSKNNLLRNSNNSNTEKNNNFNQFNNIKKTNIKRIKDESGNKCNDLNIEKNINTKTFTNMKKKNKNIVGIIENEDITKHKLIEVLRKHQEIISHKYIDINNSIPLEINKIILVVHNVYKDLKKNILKVQQQINLSNIEKIIIFVNHNVFDDELVELVNMEIEEELDGTLDIDNAKLPVITGNIPKGYAHKSISFRKKVEESISILESELVK
ncbi:MAG: hypothetical protein ACOCRK_01450 [bacterium]